MTAEKKAKLYPLEQSPEALKPAEVHKETISVPAEAPRERAENIAESVFPVATPVVVTPLAASKDPILERVEGILEEDLKEVYDGLPTELKPRFRAKGEEVALAITALLEGAKFRARQILKLIVEWLKMIPGMNRFFLEQEAAIKTRKITAIAQEDMRNGKYQ